MNAAPRAIATLADYEQESAWLRERLDRVTASLCQLASAAFVHIANAPAGRTDAALVEATRLANITLDHEFPTGPRA